MRLAVLFSGQGNQQPEHLARLKAEGSSELQNALAEAIPSVWQCNSVSLSDIQTNKIAQPLIFALQMHLWGSLQRLLPKPVCVAGYSLGEMAACCAAGAFPITDGVSLCATRAGLMDACVDGEAGLLAVIGLTYPEVELLAKESRLIVAIRNSGDHFVLGGLDAGLKIAASLAEIRGATRIVRLAVNTPSHTPFLTNASSQFIELLKPYSSTSLKFKVLSAIDGHAANTTPGVINALATQISTPLDWAACLGAVIEMQPDVVLEIGPGSALSKMWLEMENGIPVRASDDFRTVEGIANWVTKQ